MRLDRTFRFKAKLANDSLIAALGKAKFDYAIDPRGYVYYHARHTEAFEEVLAKLRSQLFESWQLLSCPEDSLDSYRYTMRKLRVPFAEEVNDNRIEFLIPGDVDPHSWSLEDRPSNGKRSKAPSKV